MNSLPLLLIISDSSVQIAFFKNHFSDQFYIIASNSEKDAVEQLRNSKIDYIVLDEKTLGNALSEICQKIRKLKNYEETPILIITGQLKKSFTRKLIQAGASEFISDPLDEREIPGRLELAKRYHETHKKMLQRSSSTALKILSEGQSLSILMIEIKLPVAKDRVSLVEKELKAFMRKKDSLLSLGNGKFIALLPKTTKQEALLLAKNMKNAISAKFDITLSIEYAHEK